MKRSTMLTTTSLISLLLLTFHLADDIVRGFEPGQVGNLVALPICVVWMYGALVLGERRSGHVIMLVTSILSVFVPYIHMSGKGVGAGSRIAGTDGALFFVWTLLAIGVGGLFGVILSVQGLWSLRGGGRGAEKA